MAHVLMIRIPYLPQEHRLGLWSTPFVGYVPKIEQPRPPSEYQARIVGGLGRSDDPFIVVGGGRSGDYVAIEYRKIEELHGERDLGWTFRGQALGSSGGRRWDEISIRLPDGREISYVFDITQPFDTNVHGVAMLLKREVCLRPAGQVATFPAQLTATIASGDGSRRQPFVIRGGAGFDYVELERRTLASLHGVQGRDWTFLGWRSDGEFEHLYEIPTIRLRDGTEKETWFDITQTWMANVLAQCHRNDVTKPAGQAAPEEPSALDASPRTRPLLFVGVMAGLFATGYLLGRVRGVLP